MKDIFHKMYLNISPFYYIFYWGTGSLVSVQLDGAINLVEIMKKMTQGFRQLKTVADFLTGVVCPLKVGLAQAGSTGLVRNQAQLT